MLANPNRQQRSYAVVRFSPKGHGPIRCARSVLGRSVALVTQIGDHFRRVEGKLNHLFVCDNIRHGIVEFAANTLRRRAARTASVTCGVRAKLEKASAPGWVSGQRKIRQTLRAAVVINKSRIQRVSFDLFYFGLTLLFRGPENHQGWELGDMPVK